uniref:Protein kinase domain-containing protein n=1 Tax=Panagrolaimus davidi TaxID=227884 RepID=A0A914QPL2_9BILA
MITNVDDFKKDEEISCGAFSYVFKGSLRGIPVAIKVAKDEGRKSIHRELKIYDKISHPNILEPKGVHFVKDDNAEFVEISDFGCSIDLERDYEIKFLCTESHISYEILKSRKLPNVITPVSKASDVWAFAVTMWQIFEKTHLLPIDFCKEGDIIKNYETGKKLPIPATVSEDFWRYILLPCFDLHPKARPSMEDLHKSLISMLYTFV